MSGKNYNLLMEQKIQRIRKTGKTPRLLLHCCCGPCASSVLKRLCEIFSITAYYYNPNIEPDSEYEKRAGELKRFIQECPFCVGVDYEVAILDRGEFKEKIAGLEDELEGGKRCLECQRLRMKTTARKAAEDGYDYFTTTLSVSPRKDADILHSIGKEAEESFGVAYLPADFKKRDGYLESVHLSWEYGLYRQNYCGCLYSRTGKDNKR